MYICAMLQCNINNIMYYDMNCISADAGVDFLRNLVDACQTGLDKRGSSKMPINRSQIKNNVHFNTV